MPKFLKSTPVRLATVLLLLHGVALYSSIRPEVIPTSTPLAQVPRDLGDWTMTKEGVVDEETQEVLKADDTLTRLYRKNRVEASLFVAAFKTQRTGKTPHSPKNCLPGAGWLQLANGAITLNVDSHPITVNRYVISHGEERALVLYWYQSRDRVVADEFKAKFYVMVDAMRLNRTDTALVRVMVPIVNKDDAAAEKIGVDFVESFYDTLRQYLPS